MPRALVLILAGALLARLGVVLATWEAQPWGDPADYHTHGAFLAVGGTYPPTSFAEPGGASALRPPAFPYMLAAVYEVVGVKVNAARLVGVLLGTVSVALVFGIARRIWDTRHALWAAGLAAVFPPLVWMSGALLSEGLFVPLVLALVLALMQARDRPSESTGALAGALLGLAVLTRSNALLLLIPALVAVVVLPPPGRGRAAVGLVATFAVVLVPWTARNAAAFEALRPLGTQGGFTMAGQWNPEAAREDEFRAAWRVPTQVPAFADLFRRQGVSEAEVDGELRDRALSFAADRPGHVLAAGRLNALRLFEAGPGHTFVSAVGHREMGIPNSWRTVVQLSVYALVLAAAAGAVILAGARRLGPLWLWLVPVVLLAGVVLFLGSPRYRLPVDVFLLMLAAATLSGAGARAQPPPTVGPGDRGP